MVFPVVWSKICVNFDERKQIVATTTVEYKNNPIYSPNKLIFGLEINEFLPTFETFKDGPVSYNVRSE